MTRSTAAEEIQAAFRRDNDRLEQLRREHPAWRIWNVPRVQGPTTWHAEPGLYPLDAGSADELEEYIREEEAPPVHGMHTSNGC